MHTRLENWVHLSITGDDATDFLHAQLTSDVAELAPGNSSLSAWCTPKGRVLTVVHLACTAINQFEMLMPTDMVDKLLPRLRMFVLRAKVTIEPTEKPIYGILAPPSEVGASGALAHHGCEVLASGTVVIAIADSAANAAPERCILVGPLPDSVDATMDPAADLEWQAREIAAARPFIGAGLSEEFIPQSLNLDALNGVSFEKGCYPGQEIVARTFFLGRLKSRMATGETDAMVKSGDRLYTPGKDNATGTIVSAVAASPDSPVRFTAVVPVGVLDDPDSAQLFEGSADEGTAITVSAPPYPLPAPKREKAS